VTPPLVVDIDGTLSRADRSLDGRVLDALRDWDAPVVVATGKATPYPVGLCHFAGLPPRAVAENGGVALTEDSFHYVGDPDATERVAAAFAERGFDDGWTGADYVNRWRETELAVSHDAPREELDALADEFDLDVVDTGFAYHVTDADVSKGAALECVAADLGLEPADFLAVGDSENDVSTFRVAGRAVAVANADAAAREAADETTEASYGAGFLEATAPWRASG